MILSQEELKRFADGCLERATLADTYGSAADGKAAQAPVHRVMTAANDRNQPLTFGDS